MAPSDLHYILMAPTTEELLNRITAWNKFCEEEEKMAKTHYKRWQVVLGIVAFVAVMGIVGHFEQVPDTDSPQVVLEERVGIRDGVKAAVDQDIRETVTRFQIQSRR